MSAPSTIRVARVYDDPSAADGVRILVDRLWPRGLSKEAAALDEWCREIAPTTELRKWFGHDPERREEFEARYLSELEDGPHREALAQLRGLVGAGPAILLTATKDLTLSHAPMLRDALLR